MSGEAQTLHEEEVLGKAYDARLMRRLLGYLRPYRLQVVRSSAPKAGAWWTRPVPSSVVT